MTHSAAPVFVVGPPRSGTTVLQRALRRHPDLWGGPETHFLLPLLRALPEVHAYADREPAEEFFLPAEGISLGELTRSIGHGVAELIASRSGGRRWVDHTPSYVLELPSLVDMFPDCKVLFMVRDGRDATESALRIWWGQDLTFDVATQMWVDHTRAGLTHAAGPDGSRMLALRFERLVADPATELRRVFEFLDLDLGALPEAVAVIADEAPVHTSFPGEASLDKLAPRWNDWDRERRARFDELAGDLLRDLGYEADRTWVGGPPVSVVIRLAGTADTARRVLEAIERHTPADGYEAIVVEDGADPAVDDLLAQLDGDVRMVRTEGTVGSAASFDRGAAIAGGQLMVFLDEGAIVTPGWVEALTATLDRDPSLGAVTPLVSSTWQGTRPACIAVHQGAYRSSGGFGTEEDDGTPVERLAERLRACGWGVTTAPALVLSAS